MLWEKLCGVYTDGAPSNAGMQIWFANESQRKISKVRGVHCMIDRYTLACKTLPNFLKKVLDSVVKIVNFIKKSATASRIQTVLQRNEHKP